MVADELPLRTRRLFPASDPPLSLDRHRGYVVSRLLEDGDGEDLRWLVGRLGREPLRAWVASHAARALSRRARVFWSLVLAVQIDSTPRPASELWPLA